jgi:hypothetical protein
MFIIIEKNKKFAVNFFENFTKIFFVKIIKN